MHAGRLLYKYMYLALYCKVLWWEGVGDRTETAIFWPPLLWPSTLCLSRSLMLNRRPRGPLCWMMAFFTASYQQLPWTPTHQSPKAPSAWCGFPYHISSITPSDLSLQLFRGPKARSAWCRFTYHIASTSVSNSKWNSLDFCLDWVI